MISHFSALSKRSGRSAEHAFTLLEMIVVIALLGIMLAVAIPRFQGMISSGDNKKAARWLLIRVKQLKQTALKSKTMHMLNIDIDTGKFWITHESMSEEETENASGSAYELPDTIEVANVVFPDNSSFGTGEAVIRFFKNGYSDRAIVHFRDAEGNYQAVWIEPFLSNAKVYEEEMEFEG